MGEQIEKVTKLLSEAETKWEVSLFIPMVTGQSALAAGPDHRCGPLILDVSHVLQSSANILVVSYHTTTSIPPSPVLAWPPYTF